MQSQQSLLNYLDEPVPGTSLVEVGAMYTMCRLDLKQLRAKNSVTKLDGIILCPRNTFGVAQTVQHCFLSCSLFELKVRLT